MESQGHVRKTRQEATSAPAFYIERTEVWEEEADDDKPSPSYSILPSPLRQEALTLSAPLRALTILPSPSPSSFSIEIEENWGDDDNVPCAPYYFQYSRASPKYNNDLPLAGKCQLCGSYKKIPDMIPMAGSEIDFVHCQWCGAHLTNNYNKQIKHARCCSRRPDSNDCRCN